MHFTRHTPDRDADGNYLTAHLFMDDIFAHVQKSRDAISRLKGAGESVNSWTELVQDCESAILGHGRTVDKFLDNWPLYTDAQVYFDDLYRGTYKNRLNVCASITSRDNLTVRVRPVIQDETGYLKPAPEWQSRAFERDAGFMERPGDEIMFIHGVGRLAWSRPKKHQEAIYAATANLVASAFWLVFNRLSRRFDVTASSYLALVSKEPNGVGAQGVQVLEVKSLIWERLESDFANFAENWGWTPDEFLERLRVGARTRKLLLESLGEKRGKRQITSSWEVDDLAKMLLNAQRVGLFKPAPSTEPRFESKPRIVDGGAIDPRQ